MLNHSLIIVALKILLLILKGIIIIKLELIVKWVLLHLVNRLGLFLRSIINFKYSRSALKLVVNIHLIICLLLATALELVNLELLILIKWILLALLLKLILWLVV